jgi:hypothetical protein
MFLSSVVRETASAGFRKCELVVAETVWKSGELLNPFRFRFEKALYDVIARLSVEEELLDDCPNREAIASDMLKDFLIALGHYQTS